MKSKALDICREFLRDYPKQFIQLFILLIVEGLTAGLTILFVIPMADYMLDPELSNPSKFTLLVVNTLHHFDIQGSFWLFGCLFVFSHFLKGLLDVAIRFAILKLKYAILRGLFGGALESFFKARWEFFSSTAQGKLLNTFNRELGTIGDAMGSLASLFAQVFQLLVYLAVPLWIDASMTLSALGLAILFGLPFLLLHKIVYRLGKENTETGNKAIGKLGEILGAAKLILGYGLHRKALKDYLFVYDKHVDATLKSQTLTQAIPRLFQPFAIFAVIIAINVAVGSKTPVAELGAVMWSFLSALPILVSMLHGKVNLSNFLPSYEQLINLRNNADELKEISGLKKFHSLERKIELRDVHFTYPGRNETLNAINLEINRGDMVALVGESGSGKSTIIDLVLGLQLPKSGTVLVDDTPLEMWEQNTFRERIGYVPQEPILFHDTIRQNLFWANQSASDEELLSALTLANADDFVYALPEGLETIVGDRGTRLSGGQRQRIALARALLRKPDLLILDEATSSLDSESERLIQDAINKVAQNTTILVIAHRLSTIKRANAIYVLQKGRIVEQGTFTDLAGSSASLFSIMIAQQLTIKSS